MDAPPIGPTLRGAMTKLPGPDASLVELVRFADAHDPSAEFRERWGSEFRDRVRDLWGGSTHAFQARRPIGATPDELLLCMAYDVTVAPVLGVPPAISHAYLHAVLDELRRALVAAGLVPAATAIGTA